MKLFTSLLLLVSLLGAATTHAQKFRISSPPANGYFYLDTAESRYHATGFSNRCIDVICDDNAVYAHGDGQVLFCYSHSDRTCEIGVKYRDAVVVYYNIKKKTVQKLQPVHAHTQIGELAQNPKDKLYHLGLQVAEMPNRFLWYKRLAAYLNAQLVVN